MTSNTKEECSICLEPLPQNKEEGNIMILKCKHTFHFDCGFKAIQINGKCPLCRRNVNDDIDIDGDDSRDILRHDELMIGYEQEEIDFLDMFARGEIHEFHDIEPVDEYPALRKAGAAIKSFITSFIVTILILLCSLIIWQQKQKEYYRD